MRFAIAALGLVALTAAHKSDDVEHALPQPVSSKNESSIAPVYTTEVLTSYETYCPSATSIEHNGVIYTVTEATTLTITNCPCTVAIPVYSSVVSVCETCSATPLAPTSPSETSVSPVQPPVPHFPSTNNTAPAHVPAPTGSGVYFPPATTSPIAPSFTGAAHKAVFSAAGLLVAAGAFVVAL